MSTQPDEKRRLFPSTYFPRRPKRERAKDEADIAYTQEQLESVQELADSPGWRLILETVVLARVDYLRVRAITRKMTAEEHDALVDQLVEIRTMLEAIYVPLLGQLPDGIAERFL